jgi:hypothetical protein
MTINEFALEDADRGYFTTMIEASKFSWDLAWFNGDLWMCLVHDRLVFRMSGNQQIKADLVGLVWRPFVDDRGYRTHRYQAPPGVTASDLDMLVQACLLGLPEETPQPDGISRVLRSTTNKVAKATSNAEAATRAMAAEMSRLSKHLADTLADTLEREADHQDSKHIGSSPNFNDLVKALESRPNDG